MIKIFSAGKVLFGDGGLVLVAGPCVLEDREMALSIARRVSGICDNLGIPYVFKASFDKANRSSIGSYRGPGLEAGLEILSGIRQDFGVPVITDIHEPSQAKAAAQAVDILQIPAFLCRQTDILVAAGETGLPVNIKKGQFMAPWDMTHAIKKVQSTGNTGVLLTERGTFFGYNNLVCDLRNLGLMRLLGVPVVFDVTHGLQLPGGKGDSSGGMREFVPPLARAGVALGLDALFMEVHDDPDNALSDGPNSFSLYSLEPLLRQLREIHGVLR